MVRPFGAATPSMTRHELACGAPAATKVVVVTQRQAVDEIGFGRSLSPWRVL